MAKILVVEDHADTANALVRLLTSFGHRAVAVPDAVGAVEWMSDRNADLVITDMMMPGDMDGLGLVRFIRREPRLNKVPVVIFTAITNDEFGNYAQSVGATAVWFKLHFDYSSLSNRIDVILQANQNALSPSVAAGN